MTLQLLAGQLLIGLINGAFYAMLSLGLAIIFGLLGIVNLAQGALYMVGAFVAWLLLDHAGIGYWWALVLSPVCMALFAAVLERLFIARTYDLDHRYGLLLTFGLMLILQGMFVHWFGTAGQTYPIPELLRGGFDTGFMFLPKYRIWVIVFSLSVCLVIWYMIERTSLGRTLRAATENPVLTRAFGINVPRLRTIGFALGVALAAVAGVLAAPIFQVSPLMGAELIIVVFAVVVIGGMGSILGSLVTGITLGVLEGLCKAFYAPTANTVVFLLMIAVLLVRPAGMFGRDLK
ncbi:MAG: branched-chain amino acid ABC transporter permease [Betaproteobacteria bacterium]|nr:branched-chain amino acid ABC transporter permease [Betaproteobacteria bacterium]